MIVNRTDRHGLHGSPVTLVEGSFDLVLEAMDELLFGIGGVLIYAYVIAGKVDLTHRYRIGGDRVKSAWDDAFYERLSPNSLVGIHCTSPYFTDTSNHKNSKMVSLCDSALAGSGVLLESSEWVDKRWHQGLVDVGFSFHDGLYGCRVRAECERVWGKRDKSQSHVATTFTPLLHSPEEGWLRRAVALGVPGAAEVLIDFMAEKSLVSQEIASAMLRVRVEDAALNEANLARVLRIRKSVEDDMKRREERRQQKQRRQRQQRTGD